MPPPQTLALAASINPFIPTALGTEREWIVLTASPVLEMMPPRSRGQSGQRDPIHSSGLGCGRT